MNKHLRYLSYVIRHKWFVLVAGLSVGAPLWRLLIHDWSKFTPREWFPYVERFYGIEDDKRWELRRVEENVFGYWITKSPEEVASAFDRAWLHHLHANPHHWQHWLLVNDNPEGGRFAVVSPECLEDFALTEYPAGYKIGERLPEVWLEKIRVNDEGGAKLRLAQRIVDAANARRPIALPMPTPLVREMVADWMGAGRAITGEWDIHPWYLKNREKMVLHAETRRMVEQLIGAWIDYSEHAPLPGSGLDPDGSAWP